MVSHLCLLIIWIDMLCYKMTIAKQRRNLLVSDCAIFANISMTLKEHSTDCTHEDQFTSYGDSACENSCIMSSVALEELCQVGCPDDVIMMSSGLSQLVGLETEKCCRKDSHTGVVEFKKTWVFSRHGLSNKKTISSRTMEM